MHPLVGDLSGLKDSEIENKIQELTKKYFMSHNIDLRMQVAAVLEMYQEELSVRRAKLWKTQMENNSNKGLDKLINVN